MPEQAEHVYGWFWELSSQRAQGLEPIGWEDIRAWSELTRTAILPEEVEMLVAMDAAYRAELHKEQEAQMRQQPQKTTER